MKPYYEGSGVTLYHGDCREVTAWLEADVLCFDPPYGRDWRQGEIKGARASRPHAGIRNDSSTDVRDAALSMWGDRPAFVFGDLMLPPPVGVKQVAIYRKPPDAGVRGAFAGVRRDVEAIYMMGAWQSKMGGRSSVFATAAPCVGGVTGLAARYGHPHAKPVDVLCELLTLAPTGVIADPTAGGGSVLEACLAVSRQVIAVELDEAYCEGIARRLSQGDLFGGAA